MYVKDLPEPSVSMRSKHSLSSCFCFFVNSGRTVFPCALSHASTPTFWSIAWERKERRKKSQLLRLQQYIEKRGMVYLPLLERQQWKKRNDMNWPPYVTEMEIVYIPLLERQKWKKRNDMNWPIYVTEMEIRRRRRRRLPNALKRCVPLAEV